MAEERETRPGSLTDAVEAARRGGERAAEFARARAREWLRDEAEADEAIEERGKVRLSLDVTSELDRALEDMARATQQTKSGILRKAVALWIVAAKGTREGKKLALVEKDYPGGLEIIGL